MNDINTQHLLEQIRSLSSELRAEPAPVDRVGESSGFGDLLKSTIDSVSDMQQEASELRRAYEAEDPGTDLTEVMIAAQKASLSFRAMSEVRNKLVTAYQDIMNMPV